MSTATCQQHEISFRTFGREGPALAFPCDPNGRVDLDHLSESARNNYFYARAMVGRYYDTPRVRIYWPDPMSTNGAQK